MEANSLFDELRNLAPLDELRNLPPLDDADATSRSSAVSTEANGAAKPAQAALFDADEYKPWKDEWKGMPEFTQRDLMPWKDVIVHFANADDMRAFGKLIGQKIQETTQYVWYPEVQIAVAANKRWADSD